MVRDYVGGEKPNYGNHLSCSSLHSDGDSYPNSPINGENIYSMLANGQWPCFEIIIDGKSHTLNLTKQHKSDPC